MVDYGLLPKEPEKNNPNMPTKCQRVNITTQPYAQAKQLILV